jgi:hypothetical protein
MAEGEFHDQVDDEWIVIKTKHSPHTLRPMGTNLIDSKLVKSRISF